MDDTGLLPREPLFPSESEEARNKPNRTPGGFIRDEAAGTPRGLIHIRSGGISTPSALTRAAMPCAFSPAV